MMERVPSSDEEEEDLETLIHQNDTKIHRHSFEIGGAASGVNSKISRVIGGSGCRRCLVAFLLPIAAVIIVYFTANLRLLLPSVSLSRSESTFDAKLRESELKALHLLRDQQSALLRLWSHTLFSLDSKSVAAAPQTSSYSSPSSTQMSLEDFRSALSEQIKLNDQIQRTLLAPHRSGNSSLGPQDDNAGVDLSEFDVEVCRKVERSIERRAIEWNPRKDRYLFAICLSGQMSNHLICLEKHMFIAALLDRMLVFPSPDFDYDYETVLDIDHINDCVGRKVVMTFDEFTKTKKNHVKINRLICYMANPPCYLDNDHIKKLKGIGVSLGKIEAAWPEDKDSKIQKKRVATDITTKFALNDEVIAIGDVFYAELEEEWVMQPGGPLAHKCKALIQPSQLIILTAQRFVQTYLGGNYVALHFRRHGFLKFCNMKEKSCFFPIPQAAECVLNVVKKANSLVIYLSTDAAESETNLLQFLITLNGKKIPLVRRPNHTSSGKWDALLYRNKLGGDNQVEAMLDKAICAMSSVFIGSSGSTFTDDIFRLRKGWGSASRCDEFLCQSQLPNFIAQLE